MTRNPDISTAALQDAATWAARLGNESATEEDFLAFEAWIAEPGHRDAFDFIEAKLASVDAHAPELRKALAEPAAAQARKARPARPWMTPLRLAAGGGLLAAAAALVFVVMPMLSAGSSADQDLTAYTAQDGQPRSVTLADGTVVTLNRGATITVEQKAGGRRVELAAGEAAFKVVHDPEHPFRLTVGKETIVDVGTEFNVSSTSGQLVVTVREGAVRVGLADSDPLSLQAGQELRFDRIARQAVVAKVNPADAFAWQDGRLVFHDASLGEVVAQLNRYAEKPIRLEGEAAAKLHFSGVLVIGTGENMLSQLEAFLPVHAQADKEAIRLRAE